MVYQYIAYNENREIVKGRLSATSEKAATDLLDYAGYQVINLKPISQFFSLNSLMTRLSPVRPQEIILFYRQLALLLESGIDIITALELLQEQVSNYTLKRVLGEVISELRHGNQLSVAMSKNSKIFPTIYRRLVNVGEQTGNLETILRQIADYMEKEMITAKGIKNALKYPIVVSIVAILVIGVLVTFVLPAFSNLYSSLGAELPLLTRILIAATEKLREYGVHILLALFTAASLALAYIKTPEGRYKWDRLAFRLPQVGRVNHLKELALCCRSLALLFRAGLPLTEIMTLVVQGSGNRVMAKALTDVQQDMLKGEGLSRPMAKNRLFLPMMVQMVKVGEETGNLDTTLTAVAQSYETEAEDRTHALIGFIQPAVTILIAIVVGFIALSMVSAMYSIYGQGL
jgi:type IV pilus assembly protein PilC